MKKIPHPWWHWFFTTLLRTKYIDEVEVQGTFSCSKCRKIFEVDRAYRSYEVERIK